MVEKALQNKNPRRSAASAGFTLIEMLVVVAIIIIITSTVLANNNKFGGTILLQNLAYDIALSTREAQVYGISVKRFNSNFSAAFGLHFDISAANNKQYLTFADAVTVNGHYDTGEILDAPVTITRGYYIGTLCVTPTGIGATEDCSPQVVDITYFHPEPDAYIRMCADATDATTCTPTDYQSARIVVMSPRGDSMSICVDRSGQISVHNGTSCTY